MSHDARLRKFDAATILAQFDEIAAHATAADTRKVYKYADVKKQRRLVHPLLYLLVEVKARELQAKALIARQAAERGLNVLIGAAWAIATLDIPPAIIMFKTMNHLDAKNMAIFINRGHQIAAMDEEVFGVTATSRYIAATTHPYAAAFADVVCAQGKTYADAFPYPAKVVVTGTPRITTHRPLHGGSDILICLQSGNINNNGRPFDKLVSQTLLLSPMPLSSPVGKDWADIVRSSIAHECAHVPLVLATIDALADAFPDRRIVVRPHPVENPDVWVFNKPNIVRDTSDTIISALERAATLIYVSGCTTGLDAYLAGVPAVRLGRGGHGISAHMHTEANTPEEAVAAVRRNALWTGNLNDHLAPLDMTDHLVQLYRDNPASGDVRINVNSAFQPVDFHKRKFPETTEDEMAALIGLPVQKIAWNTFFVRAVANG